MSDKISSELYDALQKLNRYIHRSKHREMNIKDGIHRGQRKLLLLISENDGIIQRDLAEMLDMRPSSLTEVLSNLEKNSLIKREQDEKDRRVMHVYLSEEGKGLLEEIRKVNNSLPDSIFSCLTTEEKEKMIDMVNKVNNNLEDLDSLKEKDEDRNIKSGCLHHGHGEHHKGCKRERKLYHNYEHKKKEALVSYLFKF